METIIGINGAAGRMGQRLVALVDPRQQAAGLIALLLPEQPVEPADVVLGPDRLPVQRQELLLVDVAEVHLDPALAQQRRGPHRLAGGGQRRRQAHHTLDGVGVVLVEELQDGGVGQVVRHRPLGLGLIPRPQCD